MMLSMVSENLGVCACAKNNARLKGRMSFRVKKNDIAKHGGRQKTGVRRQNGVGRRHRLPHRVVGRWGWKDGVAAAGALGLVAGRVSGFSRTLLRGGRQ